MPWIVPLLALLALIGSLAGINTWTVGPAKGLLVSAEDGFLPAFLRKVNERGVPTGMLIFQAVIGSLLSLLFLWMDSHSAAYWILTGISTQFAVVQYGLIFAAALSLRYSQPKVERAYRVPGNMVIMWLVCGIGILACLFGFLIVFLPPEQLQTGNKLIFQSILLGVLIVLSLLPLCLSARLFRRGYNL
jgi:amino acid transporter